MYYLPPTAGNSFLCSQAKHDQDIIHIDTTLQGSFASYKIDILVNWVINISVVLYASAQVVFKISKVSNICTQLQKEKAYIQIRTSNCLRARNNGRMDDVCLREREEENKPILIDRAGCYAD